MVKTNINEFVEFVKSEQKFGTLKYFHLYSKYKVRSRLDKDRLKNLFDAVEKEVIKEVVNEPAQA